MLDCRPFPSTLGSCGVEGTGRNNPISSERPRRRRTQQLGRHQLLVQNLLSSQDHRESMVGVEAAEAGHVDGVQRIGGKHRLQVAPAGVALALRANATTLLASRREVP